MIFVPIGSTKYNMESTDVRAIVEYCQRPYDTYVLSTLKSIYSVRLVTWLTLLSKQIDKYIMNLLITQLILIEICETSISLSPNYYRSDESKIKFIDIIKYQSVYPLINNSPLYGINTFLYANFNNVNLIGYKSPLKTNQIDNQKRY